MEENAIKQTTSFAIQNVSYFTWYEDNSNGKWIHFTIVPSGTVSSLKTFSFQIGNSSGFMCFYDLIKNIFDIMSHNNQHCMIKDHVSNDDMYEMKNVINAQHKNFKKEFFLFYKGNAFIPIKVYVFSDPFHATNLRLKESIHVSENEIISTEYVINRESFYQLITHWVGKYTPAGCCIS